MTEVVMLSKHLTEDEIWAARVSSSYVRQLESGLSELVLSDELLVGKNFGGQVLHGLGLEVATYFPASPSLEEILSEQPWNPDYRIETVSKFPKRGDSALMR